MSDDLEKAFTDALQRGLSIPIRKQFDELRDRLERQDKELKTVRWLLVTQLTLFIIMGFVWVGGKIGL